MIAANYPEIQVILGSHTHHLFKDGEKLIMCNQQLLANMDSILVKCICGCRHEASHKLCKTIETASLEEQATDAKEIAGYLTEGHRLLQRSKLQ